MAGRWNDEPERGYRDGSERYDAFGRNDERDRWSSGESRSFGRDRVFGERDSGMGYNQSPNEFRDRQGAKPDWQDRDYQGVSPAFSHHRDAYDSGYQGNPSRRPDAQRGGRYYGDAGHGGFEEGHRFGSRDADARWAREMGRPYSGGTGGYDYERGYGDAGRGRDGGPEFGRDLEDRARDAGDFFRRTGQKISSWFNDFGRDDERDYTDGRGAYDMARSHRGVGPKGYKRADDRISDDVHQHLTDDHWLDASDIDIAVADGEVTLSGMVDSREAKHRAERVVEHLSGVKHVQNNLRIRQGGYGASSTGASAFGAGAQPASMRTEGDASMETSANARNKT